MIQQLGHITFPPQTLLKPHSLAHNRWTYLVQDGWHQPRSLQPTCVDEEKNWIYPVGGGVTLLRPFDKEGEIESAAQMQCTVTRMIYSSLQLRGGATVNDVPSL